MTVETPSTSTAGLRGLLDRLPGWFPAVADQGMIAVTNLALSVIISQVAGIGALGVYSLVSMTMLACLGFERTLVTDPWLSSRIARFPRRAHEEDQYDARRFGPELRLVILWSAALSTIPTLAVAWFAGGGVTPWLVTGITAALFILQDAGRYIAYKTHDIWRALLADTLLFVVTALGIGLGLVLDHLDLMWILVSYSLGFLAGALPSVRNIVGPLARHTAGNWWITVCKPLGMPLLQDSVAFFVSTNVSSYMLAALASRESVGGVRVVTTLYSPLAMVFTGMSMWLVPALTTRGLAETAGMRRKAMLGLSGAGALATALAVALGPWLAPLVFGADAQPTRMALLLGGVSTWLNAIASTWIATVKVFGKYRPISWARTISGVAILALLAAVAASRSVDGYLLLLLLQNAAVAGVAWSLQKQSRPSLHERKEEHV